MNVLSHDASLGTLKVLGGVLGQVIMSRPLVPPSAFDQSGVTVQFEGEPRPMMEARDRRLFVYCYDMRKGREKAVLYMR